MAQRPSPHAGAICAVDPSGTEARLRRILDPASPRRRPSFASKLAARTVALLLAVTLARASALAVAPRPAVPSPVCGPPTPDAPAAVLLDTSFVGDVERCFGSAPTGRLTLHWDVDFWGRATEVCVTRDATGDPAVVACVNALVEEGAFPELRGRTVEVSFPVSR